MSSKLTSLSAQLKRLQVPQTNVLNTVADRKRVSFLYDAKEAAMLDSEAVYCLAMNGLEQLKAIDSETFESFELTLFNSSSINFERAIQSKQVNEKLNLEIRRFLLHLSPYFMLKPAHKAFEWLVYRYQVHLYNIKEIFMCILPYHETNYFVRALQMLQLDVNNATLLSAGASGKQDEHHLWSWLLDNQKSGVHLASNTLATHLFSDLSFFNFFIEYLNECLDKFTDDFQTQSFQQQKIWINSLNFCLSFFTKLLLQSVKQLALASSDERARKNQNNKQQESFFAQLLPVLFAGFKSNIIAYKQSAYLISSYLFEKFEFTPESTNKALFAIVKGLSTFRLNKMDDEDEDELEANDEDMDANMKPNGEGKSKRKSKTKLVDLNANYDEESIDCMRSALLAICLICQSARQHSSSSKAFNLSLINKNFMRKLFKNFNEPAQQKLLIETVQNLNDEYRIDEFLKCFLSRLFQEFVEFDKQHENALNKMSVDLDQNDDEIELRDKGKQNVYFEFLLNLFSSIRLKSTCNEKTIEFLIDNLFYLLVSQLDSDKNNNNQNNDLPNLLVEFHLCELIHKFECQYPAQFDACLRRQLVTSECESPSDTESFIHNHKRRNYFLSTISCKFSSFKCKSTFKYQQVNLNASSSQPANKWTVSQQEGSELNILLSLNHSNEAIRANALVYILNELTKSSSTIPFDKEFIGEQLRLKLETDQSPLVLLNVLKFDVKLLDFVRLEQLLDNENLLVNLFTPRVYGQVIDLNDQSAEMRQVRKEHSEKWLSCREQALNLIFNVLFKKSSDQMGLFFNAFLAIMSNLFELGEVHLLDKLKSTQFVLQIEANSQSSPKKHTNGHVAHGQADQTNELFEAYLHLCVKYMLSNENKIGINLIRIPKSFQNLEKRLEKQQTNESKALTVLDVVIFETCVRICAQSLFISNAAHFLTLSVLVLNSLICPKFKLKKVKNQSELNEELNEQQQQQQQQQQHGSAQLSNQDKSHRFNSFTNYQEIIASPSQKDHNLLNALYQNLFKSISIQMSNFVNTNCKYEIESILTRIYISLCNLSESGRVSAILLKFMQSNCFFVQSTSSSSPTGTPSKLCSTTNSSSSFFQFIFKFLLYSPSNAIDDSQLQLTQLTTINLIELNFDKLVVRNSDANAAFQALTWLLMWCLCSEDKRVRAKSMKLLEQVQQCEPLLSKAENDWIVHMLKKVFKHREEIQTDGGEYMRRKCLNKIFDVKQADTLLKQVNAHLSMAMNNKGKYSSALANNYSEKQFTFYYLDDVNAKQVLNKFKFCLLDMCQHLKDETKSKMIESVFHLLLNYLNNESTNGTKCNLVEQVVKLSMDAYMVTSKSSEFFNQHDKYFDYLIGYLNNKNNVQLIGVLKAQLIAKLAQSNRQSKFFNQLGQQMQLDLLKTCFDLLTRRDESQHNKLLLSECLSAFNLTSQHFIYLFKERCHLVLANNKKSGSLANSEPKADTAKELRRQMSTQPSQTSEHQQVDWKCLRLVMERLQSLLIEQDKKMDMDQDGQSQDNTADNFTQLIEYLFAALEMAEKKFVEPIVKPTEEPSVNMDVELDQDDEEQDPIKLCLLIELMAINSLLSIYKLNKLSKTLDESKFNIELLMQILQTKRDVFTVDECNSTNEYEQDRTNVQENVLLLLSEIGSIFPDKVLEHVLIMFVFVGNKLVRKDDSYSFQIINQIIRTILPSIVNNVADDESNRLNQSNNEMKRHQKKLPFVSSLVCKILQSFVVALPHIPAHRKSIIFDQLLTIVGLDEYLWITSIQSIDYHLVQSNELLDFKNQIEKLKQKESEQNERGDEHNEALKNEKKLRDQIKSSIQSMISMFVQFEPTNLVQSSVYHLTFLNKYLKSLFDKALQTINSDKPHLHTKKEPVYAHLACQLDNYNLLQMKYLAYNLMTFVSDLLSSEELIMKLAHLYESKSDESIASLFEHLLEKILLLILDLTQMFNAFEQQLKQHKLNATSKMLLDDLRKFHKALLNRSYELMERAINLLDSKQFIMVVKSLLKHESVQIRRRVLGLLNNKLRKYEPDEKETTLLIAMIDDLLDSVQLRCSDTTNQNEIEINNQTILFSIKLLCKRIGEQNPLAFGKVLKYLSDNLVDKALYVKQDAATSSSFQKVNLLSSVLLCIGEICLKLKSNTLIYLNKIMIFVLEIVDLISAKLDVSSKDVEHLDLLNDFQRSEEGNKANLATASAQFKSLELLILSSVTCLQKIVQHMANFLSPFLQRLLHFSCSMSHLIQTLQQDEQNRLNCVQIESKLALLRSSLAIQIPLRLLAPILSEQSVQQVAAESASKTQISLKHVQFYMQIVRASIQKATQEDIVSNIRMLRTMFTNLFDLRTNYAKSMSKSAKAVTKKLGKKFESFMTDELSKYENFVIEAFCEFTYKLSEDLFRPIFFKMYEWATANEPPKDRQITFYRATHRLSDKLKSLFVLFAPQFVQHATELLNSLNSSKTDEKYFSTSQSYDKENLLLVSLVDTLSNVFLNDAQRSFVSKDRFNLVMEPLVDQIENEFDYGDYRKYVKEHLGPCIANLASCCTQEDTMCRKFNYQILLKTKHSSVQVRLASVDVLNMFSKKLGDLYNSYLSDTMPFLSELMEDPIEEVEDQVQHLISELEDMLGESLQSHLI